MDNKDNKQKSTLNIIRRIDIIRGSKEKMTFKNSVHYLWSFIILGINWMVYKKVLFTLLISLLLVASLVWSPHLGIILCILTPIFLGMYGKHLYFNISEKNAKADENKETKMLLPSSLLIIWGLIIFVGILFLDGVIEILISKL